MLIAAGAQAQNPSPAAGFAYDSTAKNFWPYPPGDRRRSGARRRPPTSFAANPERPMRAGVRLRQAGEAVRQKRNSK
jgi:hypothetical protein